MRILIGLVLALLLSPSAHAQSSFNRSVTDLLGVLDEHIDEPVPKALQLKLGVGGVLTSRLDDAPNIRAYPLPYLSLQYRDVLTIDDTQARVNLIPKESTLGQAGFKAGPMVRIDPGRGNVSRPGIPGLNKVPVSLEGGGYVAYSFGPARLRIKVRKDLTAGHHGTVAEFEARTGLYQHGNFGAGMQVAALCGSHTYINAFYGITPVQAIATGLRPYAAAAGFKDVNTALFAEYKFSPSWSMLGAAQYVRLVGDPADSPIAARRGLTNRINLGVFVIYTFGAKRAQG